MRPITSEKVSLFKLLCDSKENIMNPIRKRTPIILIAHSMGNPVSLYWLNNLVTQEWKDKYIKSFVSLAGVWGGAAKTVRLMTSGDNIDVIVVSPIKVRPYQR